MASNKKKNQYRNNTNNSNNYRYNNNNKNKNNNNTNNSYNRYQKNVDRYDDIDLSVTKQQQLVFDDIDLDATLNLDTSFIEAKGKNRKKVVEKTLENNRREFENLRREENKPNKNNSLYAIIAILGCLCIGLVSFDVIYFANLTEDTPKREIIYKDNDNKVTSEVVDENILFLGDSLSKRYDLKKYYEKFRVVNSGIDGDKTQDILNNMKKRVYDYNPSKVFLLIGVNDLYEGKSKEDIVKDIKEIIDLIKENRPYAKIYLESLYPVNKTDDEKIEEDIRNYEFSNDDIKDINKKLESLAKDEKITYIDMFSELVDDEGNLKIEYTNEGLHISDEGYDKITEVLNKYIKEND